MSSPPPTHPGLIEVVKRPGAFQSAAFSLVSLPAGAVVTEVTTATPAPVKAYTSVQVSRDAHVELNSDLVFCNHSCEPSVVFDMERMQVRVVDDRPLAAGQALTFFYPSTEWSMAQPFDCTCGADACKGRIHGAGMMPETELRGYWLNKHIIDMLAERSGKVAE